ncbi:MAG: lipid A deacylase LpxR family protein [Phycisphaerae bacterium]|nr:lipid A deacylase LpxR family protein [Saprospiraceae bacterium]
MKLPKHLFAIFCFFASAALSAQSGTAADSIFKTTGFYFYTDQDFFVDKYNEDRNYTMGVNLGIFGPVADQNFLGMPWLRKKVDKFSGVDQHHCANNQFNFPGFSVFVSGFTPLNLDTLNPIIGDRPYASLVCLSSSYVSANRLMGWAVLSELNVGMLGLQLAPDFQIKVHEEHWLGSTRPTPRGWHNQISNGGEPTLMYRIGYRKRLLEQFWKVEKWPNAKRFQLIGTAETMLGYYTNASVGVEAKLGFFSNNFWEMASGTSLGGNQQGQGQPKIKSPFVEAYLYAAFRQRVVGYNALLQGQFRRTAYRMGASDIERLVGEYDLGIGARIWKINIQLGVISGRSPEYRGDYARPHIWGSFLLRASWDMRFKYTERECPEENE